MKSYRTDLGILDEPTSNIPLISLTNIHVPPAFNNLIPFLSTLRLVQSYDDKNLREYILSSIIPLEDFHRKITTRKNPTNIDKRLLLLLELLRWFKEDFFTWFDHATCNQCKTPMKFIEYTQPTREEKDMGHASRVEFYR